MSEKFQKFARLTKVDAATRTVTGIAVSETPDRAGEIFDYETSKAYWQQWTDSIAKATDGKSVGNVREMHGNSAAGKLLSIMFDDDAKSIEVVAKVVDDAAWKKCEEGVYAGFSMGGNYVRKWDDGALKRYTGKPSEISLVDLPCIPDALFTDISKSAATFDLTKADGTHELRKFVSAAPIGNSEVGTEAAGAVAKGAAIPDAVAQAFAPDGLPAGLSVDDAARAVVIHKRGDASEAAKLLQASAVIIAKAAPQRAAQCDALQKGLYTVRSLADCLMSLSWVQSDAAYEAAQEGDNSPVPAMLRATMEELGKALVAMTQEEVGELLACANKGTGGGDLAKSADVDMLRKAAAAVDASAVELRKAFGMTGASVADLFKAAAKHYVVLQAVAKAVDLPPGASWDDLPGLAAPVDESAELTKAHKVIDEATTALTKVAGERDALLQKVATLEAAAKAHAAAPAPTTNAPQLYAVDKATEINVGGKSNVEVTPITKNGGETDTVATAIKKAQRADPAYVLR